ncbi:MAG: carboxypeptidase M32 [Clostridiales bacterium]|nr:carboxypeptidase M32 [Clostridiales bacterium]
MTYYRRLKEFRNMITQAEYYDYILNTVVFWDKALIMPKKSIEYRSSVISFLGDKRYRLLSSPEFAEYITYFDGNKENSEVTEAMIRNLKQSSEGISAIPQNEYKRYITLIAKSEQIWEEAKVTNDFEKFLPYLKEIMATFRKFADYWGYEKEPYDALLNFYVEDFSCDKVDKLIEPLKPALIEFNYEQNHKARKGVDKDQIKKILGDVPVEKQLEIWKYILKEIGFDFECGRVDPGPYTTILANNPTDVRIINSYEPDDITVGIFNVLHSGGKGIYQQNIDLSLMGTMLADPPSCAIKESIGRFYENIIGKNYGFWQRIFHGLCQILPDIEKVGIDNMYSYINRTDAGPIRISAGESTYLLHIIIRYELERHLIAGNIDEEECRRIWNEKYKEYLGVNVKSDSDGILQDIHWASGYIGYFPTYILANIVSAQFTGIMENELGSLDSLLEKEGIGKINEWMKANVYKYGSLYDSYDLIKTASGEELNPQYYMDYLRKKFSL